MPNFPRLIPIYTVLVMLPLTLLAFHTPGSIQAASPQNPVESTPAAPAMLPTNESWITVDLPPDATQLQHGAEIYRLVCSACHAYDGSGLTDEWRATWDPESQNCWQAKCHHSQLHPPDGFYLPVSPAIVGPVIPALFETAEDLNQYNYNKMPWHNPQSLLEEEAWAVTAYVLYLNGIDPGPNLDADSASKIQLRPAQLVVELTPTEEINLTLSPPSAIESERNTILPLGMVALGVVIVLLVTILIVFLRR